MLLIFQKGLFEHLPLNPFTHMLNSCRKIMGNIYVASFLVFTFVFASCGRPEAETPEISYGGEDIFRAVFFLQGEAVTKLEALQGQLVKKQAMFRTYPGAEKASAEFAEEIISQIKKFEPAYFDQFKKQIQSDNLFKIQLAVENGAKMIRIAGLTSQKYGGIFKLADKLSDKKVDLAAEDFKNLDTSKEEDMKKFKSLLKERYSIDIDDSDYKVACTPALAICVALLIGGVIAVTVAAVLVEVYAGAIFWGPSAEGFGGGSSQLGNAYLQNNYIIADLAKSF